MNARKTEWDRLVAAARQVPADARVLSAPTGFSTRVVAQAFAMPERGLGSVFDRLGWRALGLSCTLAVACAAVNFSTVSTAFEEDSITLTDPVAEAVASL